MRLPAAQHGNDELGRSWTRITPKVRTSPPMPSGFSSSAQMMRQPTEDLFRL
jgi:hypothetical protein